MVRNLDVRAAADAAAAAAASAGSASEDRYFDAVHGPLGSVLGAAVDAVVRARSADPVRSLAAWLTSELGSSDAALGKPAAAPAAPAPAVAPKADKGEVKRLKEELRELEDSCRLLETDNDTLKKIVHEYEQEMASLRKEMKAVKASKAAAKRAPSNEVGAFTMSDDSD